ncbi:CLUMA_CG009361, isoform A [Clunio marinus]|uniref:CLUMA_CG009361, isoform A n=1 Tax=Clunio marinus TaxID=568069 RepID=A0A1J1I6U8_9DIPT|nr:CLUMA_CG009361, isoform A [Clunio marinus]
MIEKALNQQPFVKLSSDLKEAIESTKASKCEYVSTNSHESSQTSKNFETPRHDLKIIIAKKSSSKSKNIGVGNNKLRLNKPNGNSSKVLSDFERLRGDVDSERFSSASSLEIVSTSEMKPTLSKKSGTVSHHDLKFENKSNVKKHNNSNSNNNNSSASHDYYYDSGALNEREKEKCYSSEKQQKRESTKHAKNNEKVEKIKASKSNLSLNVPKLKIELPSLKTTITVPKTPNDTYSISSKSPHSPRSSETPLKKVRFDISSKSPSDPCFNFNNDESNTNFVNQKEYAAKIGLKPVERKVESIILHRKRKKSKHSREAEHSKRPKLHVSSSLDESLKLKLKIMGGKSCKKTNEEDASTCNLKTILCKTTADLPSTNEHEEKQKNIREKQATGVTGEDNSVGMENHKYSVTEQKNIKSGSDQPMVFIPKLVLQKTPSTTATDDKLVASSNDSTQRRKSFLHEQSKTNTNESIKSNVKSFDAISSSDCVNPKLMKPPTAKMGSPKQSQISTTFSLSPIRPHSIPASLKLSPISQSPPSTSVKSDLNIHNQNLKRSLSLGAEKSTSSYMNSYMKSNKISFQNSSHDMQQFSKVPPLIPSANSMLKSFYGSMIQPTKTTSTTNSSSTSSPSKSQSPHHSFNKLPNINVKDPIKLFPNACPSVEILKIPQKTFSPAGNIKLNRPMHSTIPLERIRKSAQSSVSQKILPKPQINQSFQQSPQCSSQTLNYSGIYQMPVNHDISLERYTLELTHDIAKLDQSLSLEKNFEHWEKRKLEEYSKLNELKNFPMPTKNLLNLQQNLSVRNIPNPSALMMSRNQTSGFKNDSTNNSQKNLSTQKETVTSSNLENSDIEEILSKSTIAKANEKQNSDLSLHKSSHVSKVNDKKSIEKLTEYLRLTAAKSRDNKQDDDNNNNNNKSSCDDSSANGRNYSVMNSKSDKFMNVSVPSVDVICIDS